MGTLSLSGDQSAATDAVESGFVQTEHGIERLHGRKLDTELHIVLENITHGFKKPNVLDLKLGKQLWDEGASAEKRRRLDKVAEESTSGSLGFRIAGMRTYMGEEGKVPEPEPEVAEFVEKVHEGGYWTYNKMYGRWFNAENVIKGLEAFILPGAKTEDEIERAKDVITYFLDEVKGAQKVFESKESRMYSASILLVYEGDIETYKETKKLLAEAAKKLKEEEGDVDEVPPRKLAAVKLIDFAHATWQPGQGPDENALRGIRSIVTILDDVQKQLESTTA